MKNWLTNHKRQLLLAVFIIGLIYILLPGPRSIDDFPPLPNSTWSNLPGDTVQNPNIAAYFADVRRDFITKYYKSDFQGKLIPFIKLPVITINHPPETAYAYVRDQQFCTFLEEYIFLLRESLFVCGYEPKVQNDMQYKKDRSDLGDHITFGYTKDDTVWYDSKTTIRFYPSNVFARLIMYLGIWVMGLIIYKQIKKAIKE